MSAPRRCDAPAIAAISPSNVASAWSRRLCLVLVLLQATSVFAPACYCKRCGETTSAFSSGNCGPANNHDCSATLTPAGYTGVGWCYTDCSAACDCASNQCTLPPSPPPSPALPPPPPSPPPPAPPPPPFGPACCRWTAAAVANQTCSPIEDRVHQAARVPRAQDDDARLRRTSTRASAATRPTGRGSLTAPRPAPRCRAVPGRWRRRCRRRSRSPTLPTARARPRRCSLQMDTVALGSLTVGGFDVAETFLQLGATPASASASPSPPAPPSGCCRWTDERGVQPSRRPVHQAARVPRAQDDDAPL